MTPRTNILQDEKEELKNITDEQTTQDAAAYAYAATSEGGETAVAMMNLARRMEDLLMENDELLNDLHAAFEDIEALKHQVTSQENEIRKLQTYNEELETSLIASELAHERRGLATDDTEETFARKNDKVIINDLNTSTISKDESMDSISPIPRTIMSHNKTVNKSSQHSVRSSFSEFSTAFMEGAGTETDVLLSSAQTEDTTTSSSSQNNNKKRHQRTPSISTAFLNNATPNIPKLLTKVSKGITDIMITTSSTSNGSTDSSGGDSRGGSKHHNKTCSEGQLDLEFSASSRNLAMRRRRSVTTTTAGYVTDSHGNSHHAARQQNDTSSLSGSFRRVLKSRSMEGMHDLVVDFKK